MLSYIMLYIVLAYLMLLAALTNAVCLYNSIPNDVRCAPSLSSFKSRLKIKMKINTRSIKIS